MFAAPNSSVQINGSIIVHDIAASGIVVIDGLHSVESFSAPWAAPALQVQNCAGDVRLQNDTL